ncbi:plasma membrane-associated cation-binding protein 1-like [Melia azedarach]|uniref:Plasma membrane-associated cation-binding protein 1-like n=1 Tax=Melia azedarach TaxID=155640 RepID=A0ACC1WUX0_MELAZ|nr:plasma membrane-associated cation-binding protein 1-like [Melia azedarach]
MGYWKSKVLPKIKKVFEKNGTKKAAAAEASKSFDDSKEEINKEFEEKKTELQPKVLEIYVASSAEIKGLVKEPKEEGLKKNSTAVNIFLEELVKIGIYIYNIIPRNKLYLFVLFICLLYIEFPGSKAASEASSKYGAGFVSGPVSFIFEKVSTFIITEEKPAEAETKPEEAEAKPAEEEGGTSSKVEKEIDVVVEEEKKKEAAGEEKTESAAATAEPAATAAKEDDQPIKA